MGVTMHVRSRDPIYSWEVLSVYPGITGTYIVSPPLPCLCLLTRPRYITDLSVYPAYDPALDKLGPLDLYWVQQSEQCTMSNINTVALAGVSPTRFASHISSPH